MKKEVISLVIGAALSYCIMRSLLGMLDPHAEVRPALPALRRRGSRRFLLDRRDLSITATNRSIDRSVDR